LLLQLALVVKRWSTSRPVPTFRHCSTSTSWRRTVKLTWPDFAPATSCYRYLYNKLSCRRRTARRAVSVKILLTVETSCTTNAQQIEVMELEGCSCSKQPRLVDCRTGVINKLDRRRRRRRVLLTTRSTCRGAIF